MALNPDYWPSPAPIAHRGSRFLWPENTMESFSKAVEIGYRHIETDLHVTRDDVLVCVHDDTVDRTTNGTGLVSSFSFAELQQLDAGHRHAGPEGFPFRGKGIQIPSFEELALSYPDASLVVDLKTDGLAQLLAEMVGRLGLHERLIVGSFSDERISEFRDATNNSVPTSSGPVLSRMWLLASRVGRGVGGQASALQLPAQLRGVRVVDERLVASAHAAGLQVHVWTVNNVDDMNRFLDIGVDGLVTDRPDVLKKVMLERGEWAT